MHMTLVVHIVVHPHTHTRSHVHPYKGLYRHTYSGQAHFSPVGCSYAHQPSRNNSAENPWRNYDKWHLIMREVEKKTVNKVTHSQWKPNKRKHNCFWLLFFFFFLPCDQLILISSINTHPHTYTIDKCNGTTWQPGLNSVFHIIANIH